MAFKYQVISNKKQLFKDFSDAFYEAVRLNQIADLENWRVNAYKDQKFGEVLLNNGVFDFNLVIDPVFLVSEYQKIVSAFSVMGSFEAITIMLNAIFGGQANITFRDGDIDPEIANYHLVVDIYNGDTITSNFTTSNDENVKTDDNDQIIFNNLFSYLNADQAEFVLKNIICAGVYAEFNFYNQDKPQTFKVFGEA